jgi:dipeptidase D
MNGEVYKGLEPAEVWSHFGALNAIPRPSKKEERARQYVLDVARAAGVEARTDARGNAVVYVPATPGRESAPAVAIQAHLDMVCEKRPEVTHDFDRDPIRPRVEGDVVSATGTTLGADNGIGAAMALAALTDPSIVHGPLELIFTVEEEIGLHGARDLDASLISSRLLINLDSEDPKELTVGCAGGSGAVLFLLAKWEPLPAGSVAYEVVVSGLKGGHSGVQIHERLANAIKLLVQVIIRISQVAPELRVANIQGGNAHNAIPRDASAVLVVPVARLQGLAQAVTDCGHELRAQWSADEPGLEIALREPAPVSQVLTASLSRRSVALLNELPHGVLQLSEAFPGKVETSANLATVRTDESGLEIAISTRSFVAAALDRLQEEIGSLGDFAAAKFQARASYPGWEPMPGSRLLQVTEEVYREVFGTPAEVQVIHAGLECGEIVSKLPGMEAISFGPSIRGAHTPEEHVLVSTVASTWKLLTALLARLSQ